MSPRLAEWLEPLGVVRLFSIFFQWSGIAKKISAAGVNVGLLDAALVVAGINRIN